MHMPTNALARVATPAMAQTAVFWTDVLPHWCMYAQGQGCCLLRVHPSGSHVTCQQCFSICSLSASEVQAGGAGRGVSLPAPVEPLLVARRTPLSMLKKAAEEHMANIYSMLEHWQVSHPSGSAF